jgi:hypothetical protein
MTLLDRHRIDRLQHLLEAKVGEVRAGDSRPPAPVIRRLGRDGRR